MALNRQQLRGDIRDSTEDLFIRAAESRADNARTGLQKANLNEQESIGEKTGKTL